MAPAIYPQIPGSQYGPCLGGCTHKDCEQQHQDSQKHCRLCGLRIGFGVLVYVDPIVTTDLYIKQQSPNQGNWYRYVHAACLETHIDGHIHLVTDALNNDLSKQ